MEILKYIEALPYILTVAWVIRGAYQLNKEDDNE